MTEPARIHPTAIVERGAEIGAGTAVGPYSIIGGAVRIGPDSEVGATSSSRDEWPSARAAASTRRGHRRGAQDLKYRDGLPVGVTIGDDTAIREYVTIHRATREGHTPSWGAIACHGLEPRRSRLRVGNHVVIIQFAGLTGHVTVRITRPSAVSRVFHSFVRIGTHAYLGGCLEGPCRTSRLIVIATGVPATARGVNVIGMRREG